MRVLTLNELLSTAEPTLRGANYSRFFFLFALTTLKLTKAAAILQPRLNVPPAIVWPSSHQSLRVVGITRRSTLTEVSMAASPAPKYVGAIDQGTSSTRFVLVDRAGEVVSSAQKEHCQYYPEPGWVEHDADEIWRNAADCIGEAMEGLGEASDGESTMAASLAVASIGITNQRETTVVWERSTGKPLHNAIVWNCGRTAGVVADVTEKLGGDQYALQDKTGLPLSPYFSATKLKWLFEQVPGLIEKARSGEALFGTIDCWLTWKLTGGRVHATDVTNAARTLLVDVGTLQWDEDLLDPFGVPQAMLPIIEPSIGGSFGIVDKDACPALAGVPIGAILGDQHAATFGQACFSPGEAKSTFGTGAFLMMNTGPLEELDNHRPKVSSHGLLTTPFYQQRGEPPVYALEGGVAVAGSLIQWLRDNLRLGSSAAEIAELAATVPDAGGLRFVPAFAGLFAPHWRDDARGVIAGLTAYHTRAHMARAAIDAAAFQASEVFEAMERDCGMTVSELRVDGGMAVNAEFLQFLADLLGRDVLRPRCLETTAMGAAYAAGLAAGFWQSMEEVAALWRADAKFEPVMSHSERVELKRSWAKAVNRSMGWIE